MPKTLKNGLNPKTVASLREPGKYSDGGGLLLRIDSRGSKAWVQRLTIAGKETMRGLGGYPEVSLAEARKAGAAMLEDARAAGPRAAEPEPQTLTFADATSQFLAGWQGQWKNAKHGQQWRNTLHTYAFPVIGSKPVREVTTGDVLAVLEPIWSSKRETANRVRQRMEKVIDWAILRNHREKANPATKAILVGLPAGRRTKEHHRALPYAEIPAALHRVMLSTANPLTRLAFRFLVLTAARSGEIRLADWSEIDWDARLWTVPAERMKAGREHRVPLSEQATAVLRDAWALGGDDGLIFPAKEGGAMSDMVFTALLRRLKVDAVPHGFRSSFRDWCAETGVARDLAEASLAHSLGATTTESAYLRSDMAEPRRGLMQQWADYCAR